MLTNYTIAPRVVRADAQGKETKAALHHGPQNLPEFALADKRIPCLSARDPPQREIKMIIQAGLAKASYKKGNFVAGIVDPGRATLLGSATTATTVF